MMKHLNIRTLGRRALKALAAAWLVAAVSFAPSVALAHGGEDHGDEKPTVTSSSGPRIDAHSKDFELVGIPSAQDGGKLVVYLNKFWSNEAVTGAAIELTRGDQTVAATEAKGVYAVKAPWVTTPGHYDLTFSITAGDQSDLLIGRLDIPAPLPAEPAHDSLWDHIIPHGTALPRVPVWMLAGTLGLAVLLSLLAIKGPRAVRTAFVLAAAVSGLSTVAMAAVVLSNGAREAEEMAVMGRAVLDLPETSRRLEDGAVFVPKPTQRLLGIATVESAKAATVQKTIRLIGQVIADPNKSGVVQSLLAGRIEPPEGGFPAIGATVKKGDVLGYLVPAVAVVDQSDIAQTQGDLDKQIALLEARLKRIEPLSGAAVPAGQITDTKIELDILRKRRAVIKPVLKDREDLRAPADGVLAQANVTAGQVVEAQSILFQIVDPANLWIEALAFDAASADRIAQSGKDALAQTADGRKVAVSFAGRSPSLRQQAVPLRFQIKRDGPALNVGESVTVHAATDEPVEAITLPRASVVRSSNGQPVVWAHVEAERFEARVVKTSPIDAERLGVTAGIDPGTRVVTRGAELINQVR